MFLRFLISIAEVVEKNGNSASELILERLEQLANVSSNEDAASLFIKKLAGIVVISLFLKVLLNDLMFTQFLNNGTGDICCKVVFSNKLSAVVIAVQDL